MKPTKDRLLVRVEVEVLKKGEQPKSGGNMTAEVLKVGPDVISIGEGMKVLFAPYGISDVNVAAKKHGPIEKLVIVEEGLILGVYEQGK